VDRDGDGLGAGAQCACGGLDCDDDDPDVGSSVREICATEAAPHGGCFQSLRTCTQGVWTGCLPIPGEMTLGGEACNGEDEDCDGLIDEGLGDFSCGMGACRRTVQACTAGAVGRCLPGTPTTETDPCNGVDDDCDGAVDEDCAACIKVSPTGDDAAARASDGATPFATIQAAIDFADTHRSVATRVCVAAGNACAAAATFAAMPALTMRNGISVYANYEATAWTRCTDSITTLLPQTAEGVLFPADVDDETILDGFVIERFAGSTTAAITVDGALGVVLSNLTVQNVVSASISYGVNVMNGGDATVLRSRITGGSGSAETIAVRAVGSRVVLEDNCASPDATTGRCNDSCQTGAAIVAEDMTIPTGVVYGVELRDSPSSRIERSAVCAHAAAGPAGATTGSHAAVAIAGDGQRVVLRGNRLEARAIDYNSYNYLTRGHPTGVEMRGCLGGAPWIVDNHSVVSWIGPATDDDSAIAIDASGDCHPVIDSNRLVGATANPYAQGASPRATAIRCAPNSGVSSRCVIAGNETISTDAGSAARTSANIVTIACDASCAKISRNTVIGVAWSEGSTFFQGCFRTCQWTATSVSLTGTGAFVDRNRISAGCANRGRGMDVSGGWPRIQNNVIEGQNSTYCPSGSDERASLESDWDIGMQVGAADEIDLHSNSISNDQCLQDQVISVNRSTVQLLGRGGIFRNNDMYGAGCDDGHAFMEMSVNADPLVFLHNRFHYEYADEGYNVLFPAEVNALTDMITGGNTELGRTGTSEGAPLWDFNGKPRGSPPRIGAIE
jgi:hypothetical protein